MVRCLASPKFSTILTDSSLILLTPDGFGKVTLEVLEPLLPCLSTSIVTTISKN